MVDRFDILFKLSTIAMVIFDEDGTIINSNPSFCSLFGYLKEETIGLNLIDDFTYISDRPLSKKALKDGKIKEYYQIKKRYIRKDKTIVKARATGLNMGDCRLAIIEDVTDLDDLGKRLTSNIDDFNKFAYVVSHDLQEPIRTANNCLELLEDQYDFHKDEETEEIYNLVKHNLNWMQKLITSLLRYSRIGSHSPVAVNLNVDKIITGVKSKLDTLIQEKEATIICNCSDCWIKIDEIHANSLFQNLIHNALKYTTDKKPVINIICEDEDNYVKLFVQDNGIGIDKRYHSTIFEIFKRLDRNTSNGTGIGLAECKKIVELYDGYISVESQVGKGTTFIFTLPKGVTP